MGNFTVRDQSFLPNDGEMKALLSQHFVDFSPQSFGFVTMYSIDGNGKPVLHYKDSNVVVNGSRKILAELLAYGRITGGGPLVNFVVCKCKFGHRGKENDVMAVTADPLPVVTDVSLEDTNPFIVKGTNFTVSSIVQQENGWAVTFNIVMDLNEGHILGTDSYRNYSEMGLFAGPVIDDTNDIMYARKTFPSFIKLAERKLVVFWTIVF